MQRIDFIYPEKSDVRYHIDTYPDSQKHLVLDSDFNLRESCEIFTRLSCLDDLWILMQAVDICKRWGVIIQGIYISYLFAARTDRLFSMKEALDLDLIASILMSFNVPMIEVLEPHSERVIIGNTVFCRDSWTYDRILSHKGTIVFPDKGAFIRYHTIVPSNYIVCEKRRTGIGQLTIDFNESYPLPENVERLLVVDDLCDGGGTFFAIANKLKEVYPIKPNLLVCHAIQKEPLIRLSEVYETITITNSYKDWDKENLPNNINIIKVYE